MLIEGPYSVVHELIPPESIPMKGIKHPMNKKYLNNGSLIPNNRTIVTEDKYRRCDQYAYNKLR